MTRELDHGTDALHDARGLAVQLSQLELAEQMSGVGSFTWDLTTDTMHVSAGLAAMVGWPARSTTIERATWRENVHPDDRASVHDAEAAVHRGVAEVNIRVRHRHTDGDYRLLEGHGRSNERSLLAVLRDVTAEHDDHPMVRVDDQMVRLLLESTAEGIFGLDLDGRIAFCNSAMLRLLDVPSSSALVETALHDMMVPALDGADPSNTPAKRMHRALRHGDRLQHENALLRRHDGTLVPIEYWAHPMRQNERGVGLVVSVLDMSSRDRELAFRTGVSAALHDLAAGAPLSTVLDTVIRALESLVPGARGSILLLNRNGQLHHAAAPSLPQAYLDAIDGLHIGPCSGACGTAAFTGEPVICDDIESDARCTDYRALAREHDLRACWSQPILGAGDRVAGTLALYFDHPRPATDNGLKALVDAARLAGTVLEQRSAEHALLRSEAMYRSIVESTRDLLWRCDNSGRVTYLNPPWDLVDSRIRRECLGHPIEVLWRTALGADASMLPPELDAPTDEPFENVEVALRVESGALRRMLVSSMLIRDDRDNVIGTHGSARDVTATWNANEALRTVVHGTSSETGERLFETLISHLTRAAGVTYGVISAVDTPDATHATTLAVSRDGEMIDNFTYQLNGSPCGSARDQNTCIFPRAMRTTFPEFGLVQELEIESYAGTPLRNAAGEFIGILAIMGTEPLEDPEAVLGLIQLFALRAAAELERARAEEKLRRSEDRFRTLCEQAPAGIKMTTLDGRCLFSNRLARQMLGLDDTEPKSWLAGVARADVDRVRAAWEQTATTGVPCRTEYRIQLRSKQVRWLDTSVTTLQEGDGMPSHLLFTMVDITDRKNTESRQSRLMAELDHRVKNTLASVLSLAELSVAQSESMQEFIQTYSSRIRSLARMHEALAARRWTGIDFERLVRLTVPGDGSRPSSHILIGGDEIEISPASASPLCMTLHELTTNAMKHGALSHPNGELEVKWLLRADDVVHIHWRERRGPKITAPPTPGFGMSLVHGFIEHELHGSAHFDFAPDGLICDLKVPVTSTQRPTRTAG